MHTLTRVCLAVCNSVHGWLVQFGWRCELPHLPGRQRQRSPGVRVRMPRRLCQ
jgi:hypothetical protein